MSSTPNLFHSFVRTAPLVGQVKTEPAAISMTPSRVEEVLLEVCCEHPQWIPPQDSTSMPPPKEYADHTLDKCAALAGDCPPPPHRSLPPRSSSTDERGSLDFGHAAGEAAEPTRGVAHCCV